MFGKDEKTAFESVQLAQWIAFAPMVFQATIALRDLGILEAVQDSKSNGLTLNEIASRTKLTLYGTRVLVEAGLGIGLFTVNENRYFTTKTAHFILNDKMTKVNMDFTHHVCYDGMQSLKESVLNEKPTGLNKFGNWRTLYEALAHLPQNTKDSWFAFDHFYSDGSFPQALPIIFTYKPKHILDIGGNTGKFSLRCIDHHSSVRTTIVDLPGQLKLAKENIMKAGKADRISFLEMDILDETQKLPSTDAIWMSQFLDCFSEDQIVSILKRCHETLDENGKVFIMETFWDRQKVKTAAFSLQMTSLYFTNIANGNSQMYDSKIFNKLVERSGFRIVEEIDDIGISHTLQVCEKR